MSVARSLFQRLSKLLAIRHIFLSKSLTYRKKPQLQPPNFDYVRYATLALCCEEIFSNKIQGQVAEMGVYKGDFAKRLNFFLRTGNWTCLTPSKALTKGISERKCKADIPVQSRTFPVPVFNRYSPGCPTLPIVLSNKAISRKRQRTKRIPFVL